MSNVNPWHQAKRPNILIFNPDQWRGDSLAHMGHPAAVTPNLDGLVAKDAVSFRWAFCQNTVCTPSRCSYMTGWYPHVRGHRTMHHMLRPHEPTLLKSLKNAGYFVFWAGKNDLVPAELGFADHCDVKYAPSRRPDRRDYHSYDEWRGPREGPGFHSFYAGKSGHDPAKGHYDDWDWAMVDGVLDLLKDPPRDKPLCIYMPLGYPHPPYAVEEPYYSMVDRGKVPPPLPEPDWSRKPSILGGIRRNQRIDGWTRDQWIELRATYLGMCARVDAQLGLVLEGLKKAGLYDDTALFFFSDHGDYTGDYGLVEKTQNTFEDCLSRVPFVVKPPRGVPVRPRVSEALVELVDMPATVEALAGLVPGHTHFGRSLLPVLSGMTDEHRDAVFCEGGRLEGDIHASEWDEHYADGRNLYAPRIALQREVPAHTKAVMCRTKTHKLVRRLYEMDELYDLKKDPGELENRSGDKGLAAVEAGLKERMLKWFLETGDDVPHDLNGR